MKGEEASEAGDRVVSVSLTTCRVAISTLGAFLQHNKRLEREYAMVYGLVFYQSAFALQLSQKYQKN